MVLDVALLGDDESSAERSEARADPAVVCTAWTASLSSA